MYISSNLIMAAENSKAVRNVLMIILDDMRPEIGVYSPEDGSLYPGIKTPNIDALAQDSLRFKNAFSQYTSCGPSRASFLTGRRPDTTLVYGNVNTYWRDLGGNYTTIPQYFRDNGYYTYGTGKVFHGGYDDDNTYSWSEPNYRPIMNEVYWNSPRLSWYIPDLDSTNVSLCDTVITEDAIDHLQQAADDSETPFFIAVGINKPHLPFVCPEEFYDMYPEEEIYLPENTYAPLNLPTVAWSNWSDLITWNDINSNYDSSFNNTLPDNVTIDLRRAYYACVSYSDALVGEILQEVSDLGLEDTTAVVFLSDHGFHLGEHAEWSKQTNFKLDTHVPMMIKVPGLTDGGMESESLVELIDLFPTLVDVTGLNPIDQCPENSFDIDLCHEGQSMASLINGEEPDQWKSAVFSQYNRVNFQDVESMGYSIQTSEYHYVKWIPFSNNTADWEDVLAEELYDFVLDPNETINVAGFEEYAAIQEEMERKLVGGWRDALPPAK